MRSDEALNVLSDVKELKTTDSKETKSAFAEELRNEREMFLGTFGAEMKSERDALVSSMNALCGELARTFTTVLLEMSSEILKLAMNKKSSAKDKQVFQAQVQRAMQRHIGGSDGFLAKLALLAQMAL